MFLILNFYSNSIKRMLPNNLKQSKYLYEFLLILLYIKVFHFLFFNFLFFFFFFSEILKANKPNSI